MLRAARHQFGEPLLKKREKWRTLSYFGQC
jgi:hypothetical protein